MEEEASRVSMAKNRTKIKRKPATIGAHRRPQNPRRPGVVNAASRVISPQRARLTKRRFATAGFR